LAVEFGKNTEMCIFKSRIFDLNNLENNLEHMIIVVTAEQTHSNPI